MKTYSELIRIPDFYDRIKYLQTENYVGEATFGGHRYLNQILYQTYEWKHARRRAIVRDEGHDLAHEDYTIVGKIYVHHLNPITVDDILERRENVFDLENLVCCSMETHNSIHYAREVRKRRELVTRRPNDTCPWR